MNTRATPLTLSIFSACALFSLGCNSDDACISDTDCPLSMVCIDGACGPGSDAGQRDGAMVDTSMTDVVDLDVVGSDGATLDTTTVDSGMLDTATVDAGPTGYCATSDAVLCEDFEDPSLEGWRRGESMPGTLAEVAMGRSHTGEGALRVVIDAGGGRSVWGRGLSTTIDSGTAWMRAWVFMGAGNYDNVNLFGMGGTGGSFAAKVRMDETAMYDSVFGGPVQGAVFERDTWQCWVAEVQISETDGSIRLSVDGEEHLVATGRDTRFGEGLTSTAVGSTFSSDEQTPVTYWIDTVEIDTSPLRCP